MAVLDNDADWLLYAQGIFLQGRKSVDGAIQGQAKLVVMQRELRSFGLSNDTTISIAMRISSPEDISLTR